MRDGVKIELVVQEPFGGKTHVIAVGSDEFPIFSERMVEEIRDPGPVPSMSFEQTVSALKQREFRRDLLINAARKLAERMADHIEDSEGWHGISRRDRIKSAK